MFIIKRYLIIEHLKIFLHFLTNLKFFNVIGSTKPKATNVFWTLKAKEQNIKHSKKKSDILSQILSLDPFTSSNYILLIFHSFWTISKVTDALFQNL